MKNNRLWISGLFLIFGIALFFGILSFIGSDDAIFDKKYFIKAKLKDAQGLYYGSVVSISGLTAGNVYSLEFDKDSGDVLVTMKINNNFKSMFTSTSVGQLKTQGALGDRYIWVQSGEGEGSPLNDGDFLEMKNSADLLEQIGQQVDKIGKIDETLGHLNTLLVNLNSKVQQLDFKSLQNDTKKTLGNLNASVNSLNTEVIGELHTTLKNINEGQGTLGKLIKEPTLYNKISSFVGVGKNKSFIKNQMRKTIEESEKTK